MYRIMEPTPPGLIEWLRTPSLPTPNGRVLTPEHELRMLFTDLKDALLKKNLLRSDFNRYKILHFSQLCTDVFRHSSV